jgi:antitoxin MazE
MIARHRWSAKHKTIGNSINYVYTLVKRHDMDAVVRKWGNSLGIRIPGNMAKEISLQDGSFVDIEGKDGQIIIKPRNKYVLKEMISNISKDNIHEEIESSGPVGNELW